MLSVLRSLSSYWSPSDPLSDIRVLSSSCFNSFMKFLIMYSQAALHAFNFAGVPESKMGLEKYLVRVRSTFLNLIITTAICGVELVFKTLAFSIF